MAQTASQKRYHKRKRLEVTEWLNKEIKSKLACTKCGQNHPATLDFHHIDPTMKIDEVNVVARVTKSKVKVLEEIAKCIVLCANCHRIHHYDEKNEKI